MTDWLRTHLVLPSLSHVKIAVLIACSLAFVLAYVVAARRPATYQAESYVLVGRANAQGAALLAAREDVAAVAAYAVSASFDREVTHEFGISAKRIADSMTVSSSSVGRWVGITVRHQEAWAAARAANHLADRLIATAPGTAERSLLVSAGVPLQPLPEVPQGVVFLASLVALLVVGGVWLLVWWLRDPVRNTRDVAGRCLAPVYTWNGQRWGSADTLGGLANLLVTGTSGRVGIVAADRVWMTLSAVLADLVDERGYSAEVIHGDQSSVAAHSKIVVVVPRHDRAPVALEHMPNRLILVVRAGETPRYALEDLQRKAATSGHVVIGVVVVERLRADEGFAERPEWAVMN